MALNIARDRHTGTRIIAGGGVAICLAAAIVGVLVQATPGETTLLGMPSGLFLAILALPAALAGLVLASARMQDRIDRLPDTDERS